MKRFIVIIINSLWLVDAIAQPTIKGAWDLDIGDNYTITPIETESSLLIEGGSNKNWDFSSISGTNLGSSTNICVSPESTPFADSEIATNCNLAMKPHGTNADDTIQTYQYFSLSNDKFESIGIGMYNQYSNSATSISTWYDPYKTLIFPFTYGDSYDDQYIMWLKDMAHDTYILKDTTNFTVEAIGYGTVKTPSGTFDNALLIKTTKNWIWWNSYAGYTYNTQGTDYMYQWYIPGIKVPVLTVDVIDGVPGASFRYISETKFSEGGLTNPSDENGKNNNDDEENDDSDDEENNDDNITPFEFTGKWLNTLSSGSSVFSQNNGSLEFAIGEAIIETIVGNTILTQGIIQPYNTTGTDVEKIICPENRIYPNPFIDDLIIEYAGFTEPVDAIFFSLSGMIIKRFTIRQKTTHIKLDGIKPGVYCIKTLNNNASLKAVIIKK